MGQHKHNPTAIAAANNEIGPKPKRIGKRASERLFHNMVLAEMYNRTGIAPSPNGGIVMRNPESGKAEEFGGY